MKRFEIFGTEFGSEKSLKLDEISILSDSKTLIELGLFFINSAHEMKMNGVEHIHLQDRVRKFSYIDNSDIILMNNKLIKNNK